MTNVDVITQRLAIERRQRQDALNRQAARPALPPVAPQPGTCQRHAEALLLWPGAILPKATREFQSRPDSPWVQVCPDCAMQLQSLASKFGASQIRWRPIKEVSSGTHSRRTD